MKSEESTEIVAAMYTVCPLYTQNCATPGAVEGRQVSKRYLSKAQIRMGSFEKFLFVKLHNLA